MKVLSLMGSPRKTGNTAKILNKYVEGMKEANDSIELSSYDVTRMDIKGCISCYGCQKGNGSPCILKDEMQVLYDAMQESDVIIMASPIYYFSITAQMKSVLDRTFANISKFKNKKLVFLTTYGAVDAETSGAHLAKNMLQMTCDIVGMEFVDYHGESTSQGDFQEDSVELMNAFEKGKALVIQ